MTCDGREWAPKPSPKKQFFFKRKTFYSPGQSTIVPANAVARRVQDFQVEAEASAVRANAHDLRSAARRFYCSSLSSNQQYRSDREGKLAIAGPAVVMAIHMRSGRTALSRGIFPSECSDRRAPENRARTLNGRLGRDVTADERAEAPNMNWF